MLNFDQVGSRNVDKLPTNSVDWVHFDSFWQTLNYFDLFWFISNYFERF